MHFLISLIIFCGFAFVAGLGSVQVISDLSKMSAHPSPDMPTGVSGSSMRIESEPVSVNESSSAADFRKS